jgi:hypothetical protein
MASTHEILFSLVCGLAPHKRADRLLGMWQAYIDDSGNRTHSPVMVLAGFVGTVATWGKFSCDWQKMLDARMAIKYFKMNEAAKFSGEFSEWGEENRSDRVTMAWDVIQNHMNCQLSVVVPLEPYYRILGACKEEIPSPNPYYFAMSRLATGIAHHQKQFGIDGPIDLLFDDQAMEKSKIWNSWDRLKERAAPQVRELMGSPPQFLDDVEFLPLQAADLLAWWVRGLATKSVQNTPLKMAVPWISERKIPGVQIVFDEKRILEEIERSRVEFNGS